MHDLEAIHFSIWYEAGCIWDTVASNSPLPDSEQAFGEFEDFIGRERARYMYQNGDQLHGHVDNGVYGQWIPTLKNALSAGLVGNVHLRDLSSLLAYVAAACFNFDPDGMGEMLSYLVQRGANPDQDVTIMGTHLGTPRQIVKSKCPPLEGRL
jgi:hypothetical protein